MTQSTYSCLKFANSLRQYRNMFFQIYSWCTLTRRAGDWNFKPWRPCGVAELCCSEGVLLWPSLPSWRPFRSPGTRQNCHESVAFFFFLSLCDVRLLKIIKETKKNTHIFHGLVVLHVKRTWPLEMEIDGLGCIWQNHSIWFIWQWIGELIWFYLGVHSAPGALHSLLGPGLCQLLSGTRTQNVELEELEYQIRKRFITFWNSMKNMKMTSYSQNADDFTSVSCQIAVLLGFKRSQILCDFFISFQDFAWICQSFE